MSEYMTSLRASVFQYNTRRSVSFFISGMCSIFKHHTPFDCSMLYSCPNAVPDRNEQSGDRDKAFLGPLNLHSGPIAVPYRNEQSGDRDEVCSRRGIPRCIEVSHLYFS